MSDYDQVLARAGITSAGLIKTEYATEIIKEATEQSYCLRLMKKLANMPTKVRQMPVLSLLPTAYFTSGEAGDGGTSYQSGLMKTTKQTWGNITITAEELNAIVPVSKATLEDAAAGGYDLWGEIKPALLEAIGVKIDAAILHGSDKPSSWPTAIVTAAAAASQTKALGTAKDMYDDILSEGGIFGMVEADGYDVTEILADVSMKSRLRGLRSTDGVPLFQPDIARPKEYTLWGAPIAFPKNGALDSSAALMIAGEWKRAVYAWRKDITMEVSDQGVITDSSGAIIYNLFQQNMIALKVTCRIGWALPNPESRIQPNDAARYPFSVLTPAA